MCFLHFLNGTDKFPMIEKRLAPIVKGIITMMFYLFKILTKKSQQKKKD